MTYQPVDPAVRHGCHALVGFGPYISRTDVPLVFGAALVSLVLPFLLQLLHLGQRALNFLSLGLLPVNLRLVLLASPASELGPCAVAPGEATHLEAYAAVLTQVGCARGLGLLRLVGPHSLGALSSSVWPLTGLALGCFSANSRFSVSVCGGGRGEARHEDQHRQNRGRCPAQHVTV